MRIQNLLEAISSQTYHFTNLDSAAKIAGSNSFRLTPIIGNNREEDLKDTKKIYYMSLARTRTGGFHLSRSSGVMFTVDGEKLNQKYSGKAVSYFDSVQRQENPSMDEQEDRVYSPTPVIKNANTYIKQIDIIFDTKAQMPTRADIEDAIKVASYGKRAETPTYYWPSIKAWISRDTSQAMSPNQFIQQLKQSGKYSKFNKRQDDSSQNYSEKKIANGIINLLLNRITSFKQLKQEYPEMVHLFRESNQDRFIDGMRKWFMDTKGPSKDKLIKVIQDHFKSDSNKFFQYLFHQSQRLP